MKRRARTITVLIASMFALVMAGSAFAGDTCGGPPPKCNSGNGNGSELVTIGGVTFDCDPGNSGYHNNGKDFPNP